MVTQKEVMTIKEVAKYLGVHTSTIYKYAQDRKIPAFKIGSDWRFHKEFIDRWIEKQIEVNGHEKTRDQRLATRG